MYLCRIVDTDLKPLHTILFSSSALKVCVVPPIFGFGSLCGVHPAKTRVWLGVLSGGQFQRLNLAVNGSLLFIVVLADS